MPSRRRLLLALGLLDEQRHGLALDVSYSVVPCFGNVRGRLLRVAALGLRDQRVEVGLRDVRVADDRDVVALRLALSLPPPQPASERGDEQQSEGGTWPFS